MSHVRTPATIEEVPEASRPVLETIAKRLGCVSSVFRVLSNSPAALASYTELQGALGRGKLPPATRERIALAMAEVNGCDYCLAAHTYFGRTFARLDDAEIAAARGGSSTDAKAAAALAFVKALAEKRGSVTPVEVEAVQAAAYSDAEVVEIVALNTLTNYLNRALDTAVDFPVVDRLAA
ncbi:hypothetical protein OPKNFCMD_4042 [Methylobacterium crusticola]|uniref:Carboxymuconolactone decarboxylase-like domain-containing protein n=1 Tax=Methylobacterium crusticola TaxID=1697972 RepID=A0ABQ4R151_9HYPH|nr:carboxymuconolactone decarboxylase family protein [Methylobacterium crusticola]GJD51288.1 hypothetical protein OPKNFCMD_4042 [Methylobacterium crusticola]